MVFRHLTSSQGNNPKHVKSDRQAVGTGRSAAGTHAQLATHTMSGSWRRRGRRSRQLAAGAVASKRSQSFRRNPEIGKTIEEVQVLRSAFPDEYPTYDDDHDGVDTAAAGATTNNHGGRAQSPSQQRLRQTEKHVPRRADNVAPEFQQPLRGASADDGGGGTGGYDDGFVDEGEYPNDNNDDGSGGGTGGGGVHHNNMSAREVLQTVSVAEMVRANPVRVAYSELQEKYDALLGRVGELEAMLSHQRQQMLAMQREKQLAVDATVEPPAHIGFRFNQIDTMVNRLGTVFMDRDALIKRQWSAATVINTACRGYDARRRYRLGRAALSRWWSRAAVPFFAVVDDHVDYHGELMQRHGQVMVNRSTRLLREIVKRWRRLTIHHRPENEERLREAASMMLMRSQQHLKVGAGMGMGMGMGLSLIHI